MFRSWALVLLANHVRAVRELVRKPMGNPNLATKSGAQTQRF